MDTHDQAIRIESAGELANDPAKAFVPLYRRVAQAYRDAIIGCTLTPGMKVDSISEIQERHGVSRETAKRVLKTLVDEGLLVQKPGMGSFVADLGPCRGIWGAVLPFYSIHYEYLLEQLAEKARKHGRAFRHFVSYNSWEEEIRLVGNLIHGRYEAVIVAPTLDESRTAGFYARLSARRSFVLLIDHTMSGSFFPYVVQSYDLGVERGVRYLLDRSHNRIAFVRNEVWQERNQVQEMMEETYRRLMSTDRPDVPPLVIDRMSHVDAEYVRTRHVDGLFCCDDSDAIRIVGRLREQGLALPGDLAVVSYGNTELARYFTPAITSIDPHREQMAETLTSILELRMEGRSTEFCQYVVQPELVVRET